MTHTPTLQRLIAVSVFIILLLAGIGITPVAADTVTNFDELAAAIQISNNDPTTWYTITVGNDIGIADDEGLPAIFGNLTLTSSGDFRIYRTSANLSGDSGMFTVLSGGNLTLADSGNSVLKLDGNKSEALTGNNQSLVFVGEGGRFTMTGGNLTGNLAQNGGGVSVRENGYFTLLGGTIMGNEAIPYLGDDGKYHGGYGGGVDITRGTFVMENGCIRDNYADFVGGGVSAEGYFEMRGGMISGNEADSMGQGLGGGVYNSAIAAYDGEILTSGFIMTGGVIAGNQAYGGGGVLNTGYFRMSGTAMIGGDTEEAGNEAYGGGGVYSTGTVESENYEDSETRFILEGGTIKGNYADLYGGGVINSQGYFAMSGGSISGNEVMDSGGGVYNRGYYTMSDGSISGNTAEFYEGGGVYNEEFFVMSGGTITDNYAYWEDGGGVYNDGEFTMEDGTIAENHADYDGGGVCNDGEFTMEDGTIKGNYADGYGGGVCNDGEFTMEDGTIEGNHAEWEGGGVYNDREFTMEDGTIEGNHAERDGGGVYNYGKFTMEDGTIEGNHAERDGGGVYVAGGEDTTGIFEMFGGEIKENTANVGSGIYLDAFAYSNDILDISYSYTGYLTLFGEAKVSADNEVYLQGIQDDTFGLLTTHINVTGDSFIGEVKNITGSPLVIADKRLVVKISSDIIDASQILDRFALKNIYTNLKLTPENGKGLVISIKPITPAIPISESEVNTDGTTTITTPATLSGDTVLLQDTANGVNMTVRFDSATQNGDEITGTVAEVTVEYKEASSSSNENFAYLVTYQLNITLSNVSATLPTIDANFDTDVADKVTSANPNHKPLAMITATMRDLENFNSNISKDGKGIAITFTILKSAIPDKTKIKAWHVEGTAATPADFSVDEDGDYWKITVYGNTFSSYVLAEDTAQPESPPPASPSQGSSVWLTETPTPTPTESATPTETETAPTSSPSALPTETQSPVSLLAVLSGLGAAALLRRK